MTINSSSLYCGTGLLIFSLLLSLPLRGQKAEPSDYKAEINAHQVTLNEEFRDKEASPLTKKDLRKFKALEFYPIDSMYRVKATFVRTPNEKPFEMKTTTDRKPVYEKYGEAHFELNGVTCVLTIYQSHKLREMEKYKDHLFLPFRDLTCGEESYGGGRFLDVVIPEGDTMIIDFNKAYNPYCAYSDRYSCPVVPVENSLKVEIRAGVKAFQGSSGHH